MGYIAVPASGQSGDADVVAFSKTTASTTSTTLANAFAFTGLTFAATSVFRITVWGRNSVGTPLAFLRIQVSDGTTTSSFTEFQVMTNNGTVSWRASIIISQQNSATATAAYCASLSGGGVLDPAVHTSSLITLGGSLTWAAQTVINVQHRTNIITTTTVVCDGCMIEKISGVGN